MRYSIKIIENLALDAFMMPLKMIKRLIYSSTKESVKTAKSISVYMPVRQTPMLSMKKERW
jgi:hypothetical protein